MAKEKMSSQIVYVAIYGVMAAAHIFGIPALIGACYILLMVRSLLA